MQEPKVTEYTNIHVDDSLAKNVIIKTSVNVYKTETKTGDDISKQHQVMKIEKDFADNEKDISVNSQEEKKDVGITDQEHTKSETGIQENLISSLKENEAIQAQVSVKASINGKDDIKEDNDQQHENVEMSMEKEANKKEYLSVAKGIRNSGNVRIENHKVHVMEHNLIVSGVSVSEKKERIIVTCEDIYGNTLADGKPIKTIVVHTRTIGDRKYAMKEMQDVDGKTTDSKVLTQMSDIEIKKFEENWKDYWIPTITDAQIKSGEFDKELKNLEDKEPTETIKIENSEAKEVQVEQVERVTSPNDLNSASKENNFTRLEQKAETQVDESHDIEFIEETAIEAIVKAHPLKVFYFGLAMLVIALMVFQCCFLPEYPPCTWFKCILKCIEEANETDL